MSGQTRRNLNHSCRTNYEAVYEDAAADLRSELQGVWQSEVIARILRFPVAFRLLIFLAYFGCKFRVLCDPRESKEDKARPEGDRTS